VATGCVPWSWCFGCSSRSSAATEAFQAFPALACCLLLRRLVAIEDMAQDASMSLTRRVEENNQNCTRQTRSSDRVVIVDLAASPHARGVVLYTLRGVKCTRNRQFWSLSQAKFENWSKPKASDSVRNQPGLNGYGRCGPFQLQLPAPVTWHGTANGHKFDPGSAALSAGRHGADGP